MKSILYKINFLFAGFFMILFLSCEEKVETPEIISFTADPSTTIQANKELYFRMEYSGTYAVIWTGEPGNNYDAYLEEIATSAGEEKNVVATHDKGAIVNGTTYLKRYRTPGVYTAVLIVTNAGNMGETYERAMETLEITVTE
jgi:hypothetical protein